MDLAYLRYELERAGWRDLGPGQHMGFPFELIGRRRYTLTRWDVLVKVLPRLDQAIANVWRNNFQEINRRSKSWIWGRCFILCLVAEEVSPEVLHALKGDSFGLFGMFRLQGGGGNVFVADEQNGLVYGNIPALPLDVHRFSQSTVDVLSRALAAGRQQTRG